MLTGDKGKTAKMIGLQCGMFSVSEKSHRFVENHVGTTTLHEIEEENLKQESRYQKSQPKVILHEVSDQVTDVEKEIQKILDLANEAGSSEIELLIDGCVFAKMLTSSKSILVTLN